jgi:lipid A 3-O-deacylase
MGYRSLTMILLGACAAPALANDLPALSSTPAAVTLHQPEAPAEPAPAEKPPATLDGAPARLEFGAPRTTWVGLGFGAASNGEDMDLNMFGRIEYFIAQDIEVIGELGVWNFSQEGKDATGFNTSFLMRYHWYNDGTWTVYVDGGIGLLFSTDPVNRSGADEGSSFNFTPRFGGGFTRALGDQGARLDVGLRWHHVSNARIGGNNDNPGRDGLMLYAGIILPF